MKTKLLILIIFLLGFSTVIHSQEDTLTDLPREHTALLIIDVQEFYFPGGQLPLNHPEKTSLQIKKLLHAFRDRGMKVIHIKHNANKQAAIHSNVSPIQGEKVITKNEANSFIGTELDQYLKETGKTHLVITGMQTHMCVEATTRAAYDKGYNCIVPEETCTSRDLKYAGHTIKAADVHYSTLSSLKNSYAKVIPLKTLLNAL